MAPLPPSSYPSHLLLTSPPPHPTSTPPFTVSLQTGFLPHTPPPTTLPPAFAALESLLQRAPLVTAHGTPGLLSRGALGDAVRADLPDLTAHIEGFRHDAQTICALYRDYSFLASAYLLEPCHGRFLRGEPYGLGRSVLPAVIARPMARVAELAGFKPFMEYAGSYALFNWRMEDPAKGMEYENLRLVRAFERGVADPKSSEAGFVLVHVDMVKHSGALVEGAVRALEGCAGGEAGRDEFDEGLAVVVRGLAKVNAVMEDMWKKSKPGEYTSFRTFIFGITSQSMFPDGVIYEGVSQEPMSFRGESGANDSMIPLCDNLLQIAMPDTPLTEILNDFRSYRPGNHREFLEWVKEKADDTGVKEYAMRDKSSAALYLQALNQVRDFRWRHWCFTREYVLKRTMHPTATGGSNIVTWLPNQLQAVLDAMMDVHATQGDLPGCKNIMDLASHQRETLRKEVRKYCSERAIS